MQPWGGRFEKEMDKAVLAFTESLSVDWELALVDIEASIAHATMLGNQGIISWREASEIINGLRDVERDIASGQAELSEELEDVHTNIEALLKAKIGEVADKLHTARSRNDQVAVTLRLYVKRSISRTVLSICQLQEALLGQAAAHQQAILPGYTHLQRAQPVLWAHHLLAYVEMLHRDHLRLLGCLGRTDIMPLGSGALAGVPYPVDRQFVAQELHFSSVSRNSIDAVSDRDFAIEFVAAASICMMHLSRLAEDIILWCSSEFSFVELDDAFATGSSIMPQKKNPDVAELVRAKTARAYGNLVSLLTTLKGLPLSYNRDLQEDKRPLFDTVTTLQGSLRVLAGLVRTLKVDEERMLAAAKEGYLLATDLADYLVGKGLPFRQAHAVVGELVGHAIKRGRQLEELALEDYRAFSPLFEEDVLELDVAQSVAARGVPGGTAPSWVAEALAEARERVEATRLKAEELIESGEECEGCPN